VRRPRSSPSGWVWPSAGDARHATPQAA
jgi:hypothetical protein